MRGVPKSSKKYFEQFRTSPLKLLPYDANALTVADKHIQILKGVLIDTKTEIVHRGSTSLGISGKGDIDVAIYATPAEWLKARNILISHFGNPDAFGDEFAAFNLSDGNYKIEISLMKGRQRIVSKALTNFLLQHPQIVKDYEELKQKYCYSKREYLIQRDKFFREIIKKI